MMKVTLIGIPKFHDWTKPNSGNPIQIEDHLRGADMRMYWDVYTKC